MPTLAWILSCGHKVAPLHHDQPQVVPKQPRMCPVCQRLRDVVAAG